MIMTAVIVDNDNITTMEHALITWTDREVFLFVDHARSAGADHIIDIGPEGGNKGGEIVACGTPEEVVKCKKSYTGQYLKKYLEKR